MSIREEIILALMLSTPDDLRAIRRYIGWVKFRRQVNNHFYPSCHWVRPSRQYHWIGKWI